MINPYVGCAFGCTYCYARYMKKFTGHTEPWGEFVDVKINAPLLLEKELRSKKKGEIWFSGVCDPYQPLESKYQLTRKILEILSHYDWHVYIQTKSPLVLRDLDVIKKIKYIDVGFSIGTASEKVRRLFEPKAPSIESRIRALKVLEGEGIRTYAMVAPILPGAEGLPKLLKGHVDYVILDQMNYHYADWVYKKYGFERVDNLESLAREFENLGIKCEVAS